MKTILALLGCVAVLGLLSLPGIASQQGEPPWWPMPGFDAAGTGHCPYVGFDSPWLSIHRGGESGVKILRGRTREVAGQRDARS